MGARVLKKLPELLSPAGSPEAFRAAIDGGADAIYVGGSAFNARINAKTFDSAELSEAVSADSEVASADLVADSASSRECTGDAIYAFA